MDEFLFDPLRLCISCGPLSAYLCLVGLLNLRSRAWVVNGVRDTAAMGFAIGGFILIGPLELLAPETAFQIYGHIAWAMLLTMYALMVVLAILVQPPSLVLYNLSLTEARVVLSRWLELLGTEVRWAGNTLSMPQLGVELAVESSGVMRNTILRAAQVQQNPEGWFDLEQALTLAVSETPVRRNRLGYLLLAGGLALAGVMCFGVARAAGPFSASTASWLQVVVPSTLNPFTPPAPAAPAVLVEPAPHIPAPRG